MEALSPEIPSNSSPTLLVIPTYRQSVLPPIKNNLPTWNRVNVGFTSKKSQVIKKNQVINIPASSCDSYFEQWTQTSPTLGQHKEVVSPMLQTVPQRSGSANNDKLASLYNKKIVFLQSTHGQVLKKLHSEIEQLKNENKALQFDLVMAHGGLEKHVDSTAVESVDDVQALRNELFETRNELSRTQHDNELLNETLQLYLKNPDRSMTRLPTSNAQVNKSKSCYDERDARTVRFFPRSAILKNSDSKQQLKTTRGFQNKVIRNKIHWSKENATKAYRAQNLVLPSLISQKFTTNNTKISSRDQEEPVKLPVLQRLPVSSNSTSVRQKRVQMTYDKKLQR